MTIYLVEVDKGKCPYIYTNTDALLSDIDIDFTHGPVKVMKFEFKPNFLLRACKPTFSPLKGK